MAERFVITRKNMRQRLKDKRKKRRKINPFTIAEHIGFNIAAHEDHNTDEQNDQNINKSNNNGKSTNEKDISF